MKAILLPLAVGVWLCAPARSQCQTAEILAPDGAAGDFFGNSVSLQGDLALLGASGAGNSGAAYLLDLKTGAQIFKLEPGDLPPGAQFGNAVVLAGDHLVVAAVLDDLQGTASGSVYVFDTATGQQLHKLLASDGAAFDLYGLSLAVEGTLLAIGADGHDEVMTNDGAVYLVDLVTGNELRQLVAPDAAAEDRLGGSVAVRDGRVLVGAWNKTVPGATSGGAAYLFDAATGQLQYKWTASDGSSWDFFGDAVALSQKLALVGAPRTDHQGANSGAVYAFDLQTGIELGKLLPSGGAPLDKFGKGLAVSDGLIAVGAPFHDDTAADQGMVYIFDGTSGLLLGTLVADDPQGFELFGLGLAIDDGRVLVGSRLHDEGGVDSGAAYLYAVGGPDCNQNGVPDACDLALGDSQDKNGNGIPDECEEGPLWWHSPLNGNWYALTVVGGWSQGEARAQSWGGHLATVRSAAEDAWLAQAFAGHDLFIGYHDELQEGVFEWTSGEAAGYEAWRPGQPDDQPGPGADHARKDGVTGFWWDEPDTVQAAGAVEIVSADCNHNGVPDVYELALGLAEDWNGDGVLDECVPANYCEARRNSSGWAAVIGALGSPRLADDDFTLAAVHVAPNQFGYFLMSASQDFVPFFSGSSGNLCLGNPILRFSKPPAGQVLWSGPEGRLLLQVDFAHLPGGTVFGPGDLWYFQAWFRDVGAGGAATSNTTDGIAVRFR